jgi:hypothetical protein
MDRSDQWFNDDSEVGATELAACVKEVMSPPTDGADLGAILGAYIFKRILSDAGLAIVPINPTPKMKRAFRGGWARPFFERYTSMLAAAWNEKGV